MPGYTVHPAHHDRNDRRKSSTVDTGRSVSVKNFEGRTRIGSYYQQNLLQIPVQTPTHNAPIISAWGEADKLDNISSLEDGLNRVFFIIKEKFTNPLRIRSERFIKFHQAVIMRVIKQSV